MQKAFGIDEFGLVDFPFKISNVQVSRIEYCKKECSFCFPTWMETSNSTRITDREPGNASEKQYGSHLKRKAGLLRPFFIC